MNIQHIESRIDTLTRNRDKCKCDGPGCTRLRNDMTRLIGIYETLRLNMLEAIQVTNEIASNLQKTEDRSCK